MAKAASTKSRLLEVPPEFGIGPMKTAGISDDALFWQQTEKYVFAGLRKAGVPDQ